MDRIKKFTANNNCIKAENKEEKLIINYCWNDSSIRFEFSNDEDLAYMDNIVLPKELFAIFHKAANKYEFIFLPLSEEYKRSFEYIFCGQTYKLYYGPPKSSGTP